MRSVSVLSSRTQTIVYEDRYHIWVLDAQSEYRESLDEEPDEEHDLHDLLCSIAEDNEEEEYTATSG